jgi:hypothetical protein
MSLTKNVGKTDRNIRLAAAGLLVLAGIWLHQPILSLVALVLLITGALGVCPAYIPFKINTNKDDED